MLLKDIRNQKRQFNFGGYPYFEMLKKQEKGYIDSWAIRFYASMFLQDGLFLFPNTSLLTNIGFGKASTHTKKKNAFLLFINEEHAMITIKRIEAKLSEKQVELVKKEFYTKIR